MLPGSPQLMGAKVLAPSPALVAQFYAENVAGQVSATFSLGNLSGGNFAVVALHSFYQINQEVTPGNGWTAFGGAGNSPGSIILAYKANPGSSESIILHDINNSQGIWGLCVGALFSGANGAWGTGSFAFSGLTDPPSYTPGFISNNVIMGVGFKHTPVGSTYMTAAPSGYTNYYDRKGTDFGGGSVIEGAMGLQFVQSNGGDPGTFPGTGAPYCAGTIVINP